MKKRTERRRAGEMKLRRWRRSRNLEVEHPHHNSIIRRQPQVDVGSMRGRCEVDFGVLMDSVGSIQILSWFDVLSMWA